MEVRIATAERISERRYRVSFIAGAGDGRGVWRGHEPRIGEPYAIEFTLLDWIDIGRNATFTEERQFSLSANEDAVTMTVRVESTDDDDEIAYLRLATDCLFLAEFPRASLQAGQWLRLTLL